MVIYWQNQILPTLLIYIFYSNLFFQFLVEFLFTINNNVWNHAVISINGTTATAYLNGVASSSGTLAHTKALIDAGVSGMHIGDDINYINALFTGKLNDFCIYNRAITQAEVTMLYEGYYP